MRITNFVLAFAFAAVFATAETFTGVITDSMCVASHKAMNITPDAECIRRCVKADPNVKYVLFDGKRTYRLSDQETPAAFAAQQVSITGSLYKSGVIKVDKIVPAKK
jgi:hypothetical protein